MSSRRSLLSSETRQSGRDIRLVERQTIHDANERLLTDKDVSTLTGLDRVTLYWLRNSRKIGFYKFGKVIRYSQEHIRRFLEQHEKQPRARRSNTPFGDSLAQ